MKKSNPQVARPPRNPFTIQMGATELQPEECVLKVVNEIRYSHLNDALLTLTFSHVILLVECVSIWIERVPIFLAYYPRNWILFSRRAYCCSY